MKRVIESYCDELNTYCNDKNADTKIKIDDAISKIDFVVNDDFLHFNISNIFNVKLAICLAMIIFTIILL
ncbi:hypothetical protein AB733_15935 [Photobacterium swingsii]|uniref:Uncharacterized protein n=1 Tax=Photobacterium swingsii TaxID=680026 RepID=A0A0J8XWP6_9GAMM|nr:hypothetical protein AB733_15935 [Photobacterium swingsii]PSW22817.1 hypothetical protein C9I94_18740 [Photobacterium swingsii]